MKFFIRGTAAAALALACAAPADAAPVTVNLRVESATRTVFEGPVTTDVRTFRFGGAGSEYQCDGTVANGGPSATPAPTSNGALATAAERDNFALLGSWFAGLGPSFSSIGGDAVGYNPATFDYLVEYFDNAPASVGGCAQPVVDGSQVLYAFTNYGTPLLTLTGPPTAKPGEQVSVMVLNRSAANAPVTGATVGGATTDGDGKASVTVPQTGITTLKAEKVGFVRSNALNVCVTTGSDGACGTTKPGVVLGAGPEAGVSPVATAAACTSSGDDGRCGTRDRQRAPVAFAGLTDRQVFPSASGPRTLSGTVGNDPSGVLMVKLRIHRRNGERCSYFSGRRERFRAIRCGVQNAKWFKIGDRADWSYLLPARLPKGEYVIDVNAIDKAYNRDDGRERGRNRMLIRVG